MAKRRVDTKFVIILSSAIVVTAGSFVGFYVWQRLREHDPNYHRKIAEEAEKKGDKETALTQYEREYMYLKEDKPETAMKIAQLAYDTTEQDPERYGLAVKYWHAALQENRSFQPALKRLLDEAYQTTPFYAAKDQPARWKDVQDLADRLIKLDPKYGMAYWYRAEAILLQLTSSQQNPDYNTLEKFNPELFARAKSDLETAAKLMPDNPKPVSRLVSLEFERAKGIEKKEDAAKVRDQAIARLKDFCDKHPTNAGGRIALGTLYYSPQMQEPEEGVKWFEKAAQADPQDADAQVILFRVKAQSDPKAAEEHLRKVVALKPNSMDSYLALGKYLKQLRRTPEAIDAFKKAYDLRNGLIGSEVLLQQGKIDETLRSLAESYMDIADQKTVSSPEGKAAIARAQDYIEQMRGRHPKDPTLLLLDGRLALMSGRTADATKPLLSAEAIFASVPGSPEWYQSEYFLTRAYERLDQTGLALDHMTMLASRYPNIWSIRAERAALMLQNHKYEEARDECLAVLEPKHDPNNDLARKVIVNAYNALGDKEGVKRWSQGLTASDQDVAEAMQHLMAGESQEALLSAQAALDVKPDQLQATQIAVTALLQLADKSATPKEGDALRAQAKTYVDKALEKNPKIQQFQILKVMLENPNSTPDDLKLKVIADMPDDYERLVAMSYYELGHGHVDKQLDYLRQAEAKAKDQQQSEIVERIFNAALASKNWDMARNYAQRAETLNLDAANGKFFKGRLDFAQGTKESRASGLRLLKEATALRPDYSMGWTILGQAYIDDGQTNEAVIALDTAINQKPDNLAALRTMIALQKSIGTDASMKEAQERLKTALKFAPRDAQLRQFNDEIGDPRQVIEARTAILEKAQARGQEDWENRRWLAAAYVRAGEDQRAIEIITPMYDHFPDDLGVAIALAGLYRDTQKPDMALKVYEPFLASKDPAVQFKAMLGVGDLYRSMGDPATAIKSYEGALPKEPAGDTTGERRLAEVYFETGDIAKAETLYATLYQKDSNGDPNVRAHELSQWIETLLREGKFEKADDLLNNVVLKNDPNDPAGLILKGYSFLLQRKPEDAIKEFDAVLQKNPDNTDALHYRAFAQFSMQGDLEQATADLIRVRSIHEDAINSRVLLARVYRLSQRYPESVHEYQEILRLRPNDTSVRLELTNFLLTLSAGAVRMANSSDPYALTLRTIKPVETLEDLLSDSVKQYPDQPLWLIFQGKLAALLGNSQATLALDKQAAELGKWQPDASGPYLSSLLMQKNYDRVIEVATQMLVGNPDDAELYLKRGAAYGGQGRQKEALADFDKALDLGTKNLDQFLIMIRELYLAVPADVTIAHLKERMQAAPNNLGIQIGLAQVYMSSQQNANAASLLQTMLDNKHNQAFRPQILRLLALARYQNGEYDKALETYEEFLKYAPDDLEALNNTAFLLANDLKRPEQGLKLAERAMQVLKSSPQDTAYVNNGNVLDTYGWIKFLNKDYSGASQELSRAAQADPMPITYLHLAKALQAQRKTTEARRYLLEGQELATQRNDPSLPQLQQALHDLH